MKDNPLLEYVKLAPQEPGVYLMIDTQDRVIYVGKAKNLKNRLRSYANQTDARPFVRHLPRLLSRVEFLVTSNDKEAILAENDLIKSHKPKFNIKLVDDKRHLCLKLDTRKTYPRLEVVRNKGKDRAHYFGPYDSASTLRRTLQIANKHFQLRTCSDHVLKTRKTPCLQYQIKRCPAPCVFDLTDGTYDQSVKNVRQFLNGDFDGLTEALTDQMMRFSDELRFEDAARIRDQLRSVEQVLQKQNVAHRETVAWDVIGIANQPERAVVCLIQMRRGRIVRAIPTTLNHSGASDDEVLTNFLTQYYSSTNDIPRDILIPLELEWRAPLEAFIGEQSLSPVKLYCPQRGDKRRQIELANQNAEEGLHQSLLKEEPDQGPKSAALMKRLKLNRTIKSIECFDISHLQGTQIVGSCVRFENDRPVKNHYRKYKIQSLDNQDDYQALFEVISRRARRGLEEGDLPDLMVIDGGKGQLAAAFAALRDHGLEDIGLISLAKSRAKDGGHSAERVFRLNSKAPLSLKRGSKEFMLLTSIRDEAHRFAIEFNRALRVKAATTTRLEDIPGIGPVTAKKLLKNFRSVDGVLKATETELSAVVGPSIAKKIMTSTLLRG